jgi:surfeit locus 1 family protein
MIKKLIAVFLVVGSFLTLCSLGYWQLQRAEWKENIIAQLQAEYAKDPMDYPLEFSDLQNTAIQHGHIRGKFDYDKHMLFGPKKMGDDIGYHAVIPMALKNGIVLVNMGWIKGEKRQDIQIPTPRGYIVLTGIARKPDWNRFTPDNSPENNSWTKLDIEQIAKAQNLEKVAPVIFYAKTASLTLEPYKMMEETWFPRNKHSQYALFWFSMAGILLVLVGFYFFKNKQETKR